MGRGGVRGPAAAGLESEREGPSVLHFEGVAAGALGLLRVALQAAAPRAPGRGLGAVAAGLGRREARHRQRARQREPRAREAAVQGVAQQHEVCVGGLWRTGTRAGDRQRGSGGGGGVTGQNGRRKWICSWTSSAAKPPLTVSRKGVGEPQWPGGGGGVVFAQRAPGALLLY